MNIDTDKLDNCLSITLEVVLSLTESSWRNYKHWENICDRDLVSEVFKKSFLEKCKVLDTMFECVNIYSCDVFIQRRWNQIQKCRENILKEEKILCQKLNHTQK